MGDADELTTERRPWWALGVAVAAAAAAVALVAAGAGVSTEPAMAGDDTSMIAVAPGGEITLAALPADQRPTYEAAAHDEEAFTAVRCYCGCESFLEHRHLLDCFVRPDGGWERHATGCAVCLAQARDVIDLRERGLELDEIVARIDDVYGGMTAS